MSQRGARALHRRGFTLVELGLVIVVIALLLVAVLQGQSLIGTAGSQAALAAVKDLATAMAEFKSRYGYLPGDMPNATTLDAMLKIRSALITYANNNQSANGDAPCDNPAANPKCRRLPYADVADGWQNAGNVSALLSYNDLGLTLADATDPWGMRYTYTVNATAASATGFSKTSPAASTAAFVLTSYGPDKAAGGNDNITQTVTIYDLGVYLGSLVP